MPTFDTPRPISVTVELGVGDIRIVAGDRTDTVVDVRASNPASTADVSAAEQTRVEYTNGVLVVRAPKGWRQYTPRGDAGSIEVLIELPAGSKVQGSVGIGALHCTGRCGGVRYKTGIGEIHVDEAGPVELKSGMGDIAVERVTGDARVSTGSGTVRIGSIDGAAVVKHSNGDTWIGVVSGDLRVSAANGEVAVDRAGATVAVRTAMGDVRLGEVARGSVVAHTACGKLDIGILDGVAAWLDLNTSFGSVRNDLHDAQPPAPGDAAVEVRGRTAYGDITIRRAVAPGTGCPA